MFTLPRARALLLPMAAVAAAGSLTFAVPASAHTNYCGGGDHWMGHDGKYLAKYVGQYERNGRTYHYVQLWTDRTWYGSYKTYVRTKRVAC